MSNKSRITLTLLAVPAIALGSFAAVAQTAPNAAQAPAVEAPANPSDVTTASKARRLLADFRGGGRGFGGRGRGGRGGALQLLNQADADNDGSVTQAEVDAFVAAQVATADADSDGAVALDEFQTIYLEQTRPRMVDAFQALDADGDGAVTTAELDERFGSIIQRMDRNGDGAISADDRGRRGDRDGRGRGDRR